MQFPLLSRELIPHLKLAHGLFNLTVMLLFFYHARNGLLIRQARRGKMPPPLPALKRHRRIGPLLALLGAGGFAAGLILVFLETGKILLYPVHLFVGIAILLLLFFTYRASRKIPGSNSQPRNRHFRLGLTLLVLYLVNVVLGIGVFL